MSKLRAFTAAVAFLLVTGVPALPAAPAAAHTPTSHWTCWLGGGGSGGLCFYHWPFAERRWHFMSNVPSNARDAIHKGSHTVTDGHALQAIQDSNAPNHVHWDSVCVVACVTGWVSENGSAQHILGFQIHFDSGWNWNRNTSLSHGQFTGLDLWMVAAHEWGHAVGMGHSTTGFGHDCTSSSTWGTFATLAQGDCLIGGHTEQRTLDSHDRTGRCEIYSHAHGYAC